MRRATPPGDRPLPAARTSIVASIGLLLALGLYLATSPAARADQTLISDDSESLPGIKEYDDPPPTPPRRRVRGAQGRGMVERRFVPVPQADEDAAAYDPALRFMAENQPQWHEELQARVLDLEPNGDTRELIERVRTAVAETEVGMDVTDEEWVEVEDSTITWGGRIHGDWVNWIDDSEFGGQPNYIEFRRLRLSAAGVGYGVYEYNLELEFAPEVDLEAPVVNNMVDLGGFGVEFKDAYVAIRDIPRLGKLYIGHFKVPTHLDLLTNANTITFLERSIAHRFAPNREVGIGATNYLEDERISWSYGIFFDELDEAEHSIVDDNQGTRLAARITHAPYYDACSEGRYAFHTGFSYLYTRPRLRDDLLQPGVELRPVRFNARPEIHQGDFLVDTGDINTQQYHILNGDLAWVAGPLSLQGELVWTGLDKLDGGWTDLYGAYAFVSYFLTGEHRRYDPREGNFRRVIPYENFWMVGTPRGTCSGWGAWEVACRWSYLDFTDVRGQQLTDLTLGVNWYWNPRTRMTFNWIHPFAKNSPVGTTTDAQGDIFGMRLGVDF